MTYAFPDITGHADQSVDRGGHNRTGSGGWSNRKVGPDMSLHSPEQEEVKSAIPGDAPEPH